MSDATLTSPVGTKSSKFHVFIDAVVAELDKSDAAQRIALERVAIG